MQRAAPFSRARAFFTAIASIMANTALADITKQLQIEALGPYRSRGKGKGRSKWRSLASANRAGRSIYQPHQGSQERIRRIIGGWHTQAPLHKADILAAAPAVRILETLLRSNAK